MRSQFCPACGKKHVPEEKRNSDKELLIEDAKTIVEELARQEHTFANAGQAARMLAARMEKKFEEAIDRDPENDNLHAEIEQKIQQFQNTGATCEKRRLDASHKRKTIAELIEIVRNH